MTHSIDIVTKVKVLLEALPYIQQFRGSVFVVKYGGSFMDDPDPEVRRRLATDMVFLASVGIHVVVVHGGGKAISRAMEASNIEPVFQQGLRVTNEATIQIVENTLNQTVNPDICKMIEDQGGNALGIHGQEVLHCIPFRPQDAEGQTVDIGFVGDITQVTVQSIEKAFQQGIIPVISPIAQDSDGHYYNTNADTAAAHIACALNARRLVYLSDVPGLLENPEDKDSLISTLTLDAVPQLIEQNIISSGMLPKVKSAIQAIQSGVHRVHFIDGSLPHSILLEIFTDQGIGTEIVH